MHISPIFPLLWIFTLLGLLAAGCDRNGDARAAMVSEGEDARPQPARAQPSIGVEGIRPDFLLDAAIRTLEGHGSITADIRHHVSVFGEELIGDGKCFEQRRGPVRLTRLELVIQAGDQTSSIVRVCDGQAYWKYRNLLGKKDLSRIDLAKVKRRLSQAGESPRMGRSDILPSLGGLPELLRNLSVAFEFTSVQSGQRGKERLPVLELTGRWRPERLIKILPEQEAALRKGQPADLSKLGAAWKHLPDQVVLVLGRDDLFPYYIELRRTGDAKESVWAKIELLHVKINVPISPSQFVYNPGGLKPIDATASYLKAMAEDRSEK